MAVIRGWACLFLKRFKMNNANDFFNIMLLGNYDEFTKDRLNVRKALNVAISSWHMWEWMFYSVVAPGIASISKRDKENFRDSCKTKCRSLQFMNDLADSNKHLVLSKGERQTAIAHHKGGFSSGFSLGFNTSRLEIVRNGETNIAFEPELDRVFNYWRDVISLHYIF